MATISELEQELSGDASGFGGNLRRIRVLRGLTQLDLAEKANVTKKIISNMEVGRSHPDDVMLKRLCLILKVSSDTLLGIKDIKGLDMPMNIRWTKRFRLIDGLPEARKKILIKVIDDFIGY